MGVFECFQRWRATDKLDQLWRVEYDIIEEGYRLFIELRGINAGHQVVQVPADPFEPKICENGKGRACRGRLPLHCRVKVISRGLEFKRKSFDAGQRGEGTDHCLRRKVSGMTNIQRIRCTKVSSGQK
jgi:hypothetical protein